MKIWIILVLFLLLGAFFIISNENLHLANKSEAMQFGRVYYSWFGDLFLNAGNVAGYAVKSEWLPSSNSSSESG